MGAPQCKSKEELTNIKLPQGRGKGGGGFKGPKKGELKSKKCFDRLKAKGPLDKPLSRKKLVSRGLITRATVKEDISQIKEAEL